MTAEEADARIILSRQTLSRYVQMVAGGVEPAPGTLMLVAEEIALLEALGEEHPGKVAKLVSLVSEWVRFREGQRMKLH